MTVPTLLIPPLPRMPPVPTEPHSSPCKDCPSTCAHPDPEAKDVLASDDPDALRQSLFTCGWRPSKLCRGWWDLAQAKILELEARGR